MFVRTLIVAVAAVSAAAAPMSAQALAAAPTRTFVARAVADEPDAARIRAMLDKADEALVAGRFNEARKAYRTVIDEQRSAGLYAGEALWHLATAYFFVDAAGDAADTLDELAIEAARFGDPSMELRATFESAILNQNLHRSGMAVAKLPRVKALLQSPAISDAQKAEVSQRISAR